MAAALDAAARRSRRRAALVGGIARIENLYIHLGKTRAGDRSLSWAHVKDAEGNDAEIGAFELSIQWIIVDADIRVVHQRKYTSTNQCAQLWLMKREHIRDLIEILLHAIRAGTNRSSETWARA